MASSKASPVTPLSNRVSVDDEQAVAEGRYCRPCRKAFKNPNALASHDRQKHKIGDSPKPIDTSAATAQAVKPGERLFRSPRAPMLRLVIPGHAAQKAENKVTGGLITKRGRSIQFDAGVFRTKDARAIAYLTGDLDACRKFGVVDEDDEPVGYSDGRYPVFEQGQMREMALTL